MNDSCAHTDSQWNSANNLPSETGFSGSVTLDFYPATGGERNTNRFWSWDACQTSNQFILATKKKKIKSMAKEVNDW